MVALMGVCVLQYLMVHDMVPFRAVHAQCVLSNITYQEGEEVSSDCSKTCICGSQGEIGCLSTCPVSIVLPSPDCPNPQMRVPPGECCSELYCDPCPGGTYGLECLRNCSNCHAGHCNITTGICPLNPPKPRCVAGFTGSKCLEECPPGSYGADCTGRCGACTTGRKSCHARTGYCPNVVSGAVCQAGYRGRHCQDPCPPGNWGVDCQLTCGDCAGGLGLCDPVDGSCPDVTPRCAPGRMNDKCTACPAGQWGLGCINNCSRNCLRGTQECDKRDGACIGGCMDGYQGIICDELKGADDGSPGIGVGVGVGVGVTLIVLVIVGVLVYLFYFRRQRRTSAHGSLPSKPIYATQAEASKSYSESMVKKFLGRQDTYELPVVPGVPSDLHYTGLQRSATYQLPTRETYYESILPDSDWNADPNFVDIKDTKMIQGNFGETSMGVWRSPIDEKFGIVVGVKRLSGDESVSQKLEMIRTAGRCLNVLGLLGVATYPDSGDTLLLLEWTNNGNLLSYLRRNRTTDAQKQELDDHRLIRICQEVAGAMKHLSSQRVFPVVLTARTILLNSNLEVKVTGFVNFEDEENSQSDSKSKAAIRWKAIESILYNTYSSQSDVWSYGVLLWEIFSLGGTPYMEIQTRDLSEKLRSGHRLKQPDRASTSIYLLMTECWSDDPDRRPSFEEIGRRLQDMEQDDGEAYEDMSAKGSNHYVNASQVGVQLDDV